MNKKMGKAALTASLVGLMSITPATGVLAAGWQNSQGVWTYVESNGQKRKGWIQTSDGYYYMDLSTGAMSTGWKKINSKWYYFKSNGLMNTGWVKVDGTWYYNLNDGVLVQSNW